VLSLVKIKNNLIMKISPHCKSLENVAYKSCIDTYFNQRDKKDIVDYWLYLFNEKRFCEAKGVEKALELIDIHEEWNGKN
tara:strand:+ start:1896 stop:2135 length:240 start_codon:yes stop_codon:yes gene_type:complete